MKMGSLIILHVFLTESACLLISAGVEEEPEFRQQLAYTITVTTYVAPSQYRVGGGLFREVEIEFRQLWVNREVGHGVCMS